MSKAKLGLLDNVKSAYRYCFINGLYNTSRT